MILESLRISFIYIPFIFGAKEWISIIVFVVVVVVFVFLYFNNKRHKQHPKWASKIPFHIQVGPSSSSLNNSENKKNQLYCDGYSTTMVWWKRRNSSIITMTQVLNSFCLWATLRKWAVSPRFRRDTICSSRESIITDLVNSSSNSFRLYCMCLTCNDGVWILTLHS